MAEIDMQKHSKEELLLGLAVRLEADTRFMANVLHKYQRQERLSRDEIIKRFKISNEQFAQLALCKRPNTEAEDFALQIRKISNVTGVNTSIIVGIIRQVESLEALLRQPNVEETTVSNRQTIPHHGALATARDREENHEPDDNWTKNSDSGTEEPSE
jgi:hypothetical protein